jgi:hypothetical protein
VTGSGEIRAKSIIGVDELGALLCEADAARHTHQAWRLGGCPGPAPPPRMDRGDTGRILEEGRELRRRDKAEADERSQSMPPWPSAVVTTAELSFDRYTRV